MQSEVGSDTARKETVAVNGTDVADSLADERRLYRLMLWGFFTLFPLSAAFIVAGLLAHSAAVIVCSVLSAISITVQSFSIYSLRQVMGQNTFRFPYGAGKMEDFSAFLCGALFVPSGLFMTYDAVQRLQHPHQVGYLIGLVPVLLSAIRMAALYVAVRRLARETRAPSPLLRAYLLDYRISLLNDLGIIAAFVICAHHAKPNTDSTRSRTPIPRQAEQSFHGKPNTDSTPSRTVCGLDVEPLSGP